MANRRPKFDQPPARRCMWAKCPNLNMVSADVDMCLRHAIIVGDRLEANAHTIRKRRDDESAQRQIDAIEKKQKEWQLERVLAGKPQREDLYFHVDDKWVYYIQIEDSIKIGFTTDLEGRFRAYPPTTKVLGIEYGGKALEKQRHEQFRAYLAYGREWFHPSDELLAHIASLPPYKHLIPKRMRRGSANQAAQVKPRYWR